VRHLRERNCHAKGRGAIPGTRAAAGEPGICGKIQVGLYKNAPAAPERGIGAKHGLAPAGPAFFSTGRNPEPQAIPHSTRRFKKTMM